MTDLSDSITRIANADYSHSHALPDQPWWENLESNFHKFPNGFELDLKTRSMVNATVVQDVILRTLAATLIASCCAPMTLGRLKKWDTSRDAEFYRNLANRGAREAFFKKPEAVVEVEVTDPRWVLFKPEDGVCKNLAFESPFTPVNQDFTDRYLKHSNNRTAIAQHWRHDGSPRPTLCVIHGFMADAYWANSKFLALEWFYKQGYDVLLYTLPFHGKRQGALSPFSGYGYFSGGFAQFNESVAQSIYDLRLFLDYLQANGVSQFGVTGISLGGYTASVLANVEERLEFCIPNVPVVSPPDLFLEWSPMNAVLKATMAVSGVSVRELRHLMAVHSPLSYKPKLDRERLMIIAGAGDRLAPPKYCRLLWEHWDRCRIHWFPGNHLVHLDQGRYLKEMLAFMRNLNF
ncbi:MAG: prolyl oligopeptidase family serine peptidase [Candidatus Pelagadaptatus aseana]|uniref:alpha/beta hydrolase n=1 Tax=Candidatus Pelagadaptatus aseana TaxID=3120508 RepID=UPI0039B1AA0D